VPDVSAKPLSGESIVGLDVDVKSFVLDSDGRQIGNPRLLERKLDRLKFLQKSLSRKQKGSNNRSKARRLVARLHEKIEKYPTTENHQENRKYANTYDVIVVKDWTSLTW